MRLHGLVYTLCLLHLACGAHVLTNKKRGESSIPEEVALREIVRRLENSNSSSASEKMRDKRALGLILSGLAQVFGYTVAPVQLASLPNPSPAQSAPAAALPAPAPSQQSPPAAPPPPPPPASSPSPSASPPPAQQRRRETIRITGVVNFGNNSDLLGHLAQYERVFHGGRNATPAASGSPQPAATPTAVPVQMQTRPPLLAPYRVKIPLPLAPNVPPPMISSPQIEIPDYDNVLPLRAQQAPAPPPPPPRQKEVPISNEHESEYRNNQNEENYSVENKEIYDEKQVRKPAENNRYEEEPHWKKDHEDRLTSLEKQQEEYASKLREQGEEKSRERDNDYREVDIDNRDRSREKEIADRDRERVAEIQEQAERKHPDDHENREDSRERYENRGNQDSREKYRVPEEPRESDEESSANRDSKDYEQEEAEEPVKYRDYDNQRPHKKSEDYEEPPKLISDYAEVAANGRLPVDDSYVKTTPDHLRDSYGEILDNRGPVDERISSYFTMFKNPTSGVYDPQRIQSQYNSEDVEEDEEESSHPQAEREQEGRRENLEEEEDEEQEAPRNKYEEYNINEEERRPEEVNEEEDVETLKRPYAILRSQEQDYKDYRPRQGQFLIQDKRREIPESRKPATTILPDTVDHKFKARGNSQYKSRTNTEKPIEEFRLITFSPYITPVQFIYNHQQQEEPKILPPIRHRINKPDAEESTDRSNSKESIREDLQPQVGLPQKLSPQKLHEGEEKAVQLWPAPFDYVFDSTEQTNDVILRENSGKYRNSDKRRVSDEELDPEEGKSDKVRHSTNEAVYQRTEEVPYQRTEAIPHQRTEEVPYQRTEEIPHRKVVKSKGERQRTEDYSIPYEEYQLTTYPPGQEGYFQYTVHPVFGKKLEQPRKLQQESFYDLQMTRARDNGGQKSAYYKKPHTTPANYYSSNEYEYEDERKPSKSEIIYQPQESQVYDERDANRSYVTNNSKQIDGDKTEKISREGNKNQRNVGNNKRVNDRPKNLPQQLTTSKPQPPKSFDDAYGAHEFFNLNKEDYSVDSTERGSLDIRGTTNSPSIYHEMDLLTIPEPTPYRYDESLTPFNDEPESKNEKVKVEEYRNRIATVKVSEKKQFGPAGPVHLIGFTHSF